MPAGYGVSIVAFERVNAGWALRKKIESKGFLVSSFLVFSLNAQIYSQIYSGNWFHAKY